MELSSNNTSQKCKSSSFQILLVFGVSYLCISCGTFLGYTASATESIKLDPLFKHLKNDKDYLSWIGSLGPLGALCGSLLTTFVVKSLGIKGTIFYCSLPSFILSWITITLSSSINTILIGRFLGGIGTGMTIACTPMYVISIVDSKNRGRLGITPQFLMLFGIVISYTIGAFVAWNEHSLICLFITFPSIIFLYFAPHTPRWLILKDKQSEALALLEKLHGSINGLIEFDRLMSSLNKADISSNSKMSLKQQDENNNKNSFSSSSVSASVSTWFKPETIKPIFISLALMSFQQFCGINGITFNSVLIFKHASGNGTWTAANAVNVPPIIFAAVQCIASLSSILLIDRLGRKSLLLLSSLLTGLASTLMGLYFYIIKLEFVGAAEHSSKLFWIPLVILILFAFGFAIGFGPVPYLYVTEILREEIRSIFNPIIIAYTWGCVFAVTKSFLYLKSYIELAGVFWVYASFSFIAFIFIALLLPETKGKSLEEVKYFFNNNKNADKQKDVINNCSNNLCKICTSVCVCFRSINHV